MPKIGRFELRRELGRGAMGVVYLARDPTLDREVALKVPSRLDEKAAVRFLREAKAAAKLLHPNIVQVFEAGAIDGRLYMASAFVDGTDLADALENGPLDPQQAVRIAFQLAAALDYAHQHGIVHRDVKPSNVMLGRDQVPLLMDFGLARWERADERLTQDGSLLGTPAYMSPEQAAGRNQEVGPPSDQFSLGVVLYEMLCGCRPFEGTIAQLLEQIRNREPVAPRRRNPALPADLEAITLKCLSKRPADRYASLAEMAEDLARLQTGNTVRARPLGPLRKGARWATRNPLVAGLGAVVLALLLAVGVLLAVSSPRRSPATGPAQAHGGGTSTFSLPELPEIFGKEAIPDAPLSEVKPLWKPVADERVAQIAAERTKTLEGLEEISVEELPLIFQAALMRQQTSPAVPAPMIGPDGQPVQVREALPDRFILTGDLGAVRQYRGSTWVFLWSSKRLPQWGTLPEFYYGVEFPEASLVDFLADYRVNDRVRVAVEQPPARGRQTGAAAPAAAAANPAANPAQTPGFDPLAGPAGPGGMPAELPDVMRSLRVFSMPIPWGPMTNFAYPSFTGRGIEKESQPGETWIDPRLGRPEELANPVEIHRTLGYVFRNPHARETVEGIIRADFQKAQRRQNDTMVTLALHDTAEGTVAIRGRLGGEPAVAEFNDYDLHRPVLAAIRLSGTKELADADTSVFWTRRNRLREFAMTLAAPSPLAGLAGSRDARPFIADPYWAWTALQAECQWIAMADRPETQVVARGPRRTNVGPMPLTPDNVAAKREASIGQQVAWSGTLQDIWHTQGETRLVIDVSQSSSSVSEVECFTKADGFFDDLADYREDLREAGQPDAVNVRGTVRAGNAISNRTNSSLVLVEIAAIERAAEPGSRVEAGRRRDPATIDPARLPSAIGRLWRSPPAAGEQATLAARFVWRGTSSDRPKLQVRSLDGDDELMLNLLFDPKEELFLHGFKKDDPLEVTVAGPAQRQVNSFTLTGVHVEKADPSSAGGEGSGTEGSPPTDAARSVAWSGQLEQICSIGGELHLIVKLEGGKRAECFARREGLVDELADYRELWQHNSKEADAVTVVAAPVAGQGPAFRLNDDALLAELVSVERSGLPASRVDAQRPRDPATIDSPRAIDPVVRLFRIPPAAGEEQTVRGRIKSFSDGSVNFEPLDSTIDSLKIEFPAGNEAVFADYLRNDVVDAVVTGPATRSQFSFGLTGVSFARPTNRLSLVTREGRATPPPDFSAEQAAWKEALGSSSDKRAKQRQRPLVFVGRFVRRTQLGADEVLVLNHPFQEKTTSETELICNANEQVRAFLEALEAGDELILEVEALSQRIGRIVASVASVARLDDPQGRIACPAYRPKPAPRQATGR